MLVCESMEACICICTCAKSSFHRSSCPIPSTVQFIVEFSPTNCSEDEGKLFIHSNPLEQVHIVYTSVTKLLLEEKAHTSLSPQCYGCKCHRRQWPQARHLVQDNGSTLRSRAALARRTRIVASLAIRCHRTMNQSLSWTGQKRALASLHSTTSSSCTSLTTTTHNNKYLAP
jgi:hypothetical protein